MWCAPEGPFELHFIPRQQRPISPPASGRCSAHRCEAKGCLARARSESLGCLASLARWGRRLTMEGSSGGGSLRRSGRWREAKRRA